MNYLCAVVKKEVVTRETFHNREEALKYFQQKFGDRIVEKMEENERRLENKIFYLDRKLKKYENEPEMKQRIFERRQAAEEQWRAIDKWLNGEDDRKAVYMEEKPDHYKNQLITEDEELFFYMAGIYNLGRRYTVTEEKYYYMCQMVTCMGSCSEAARHLPKKMSGDNCSLYVCEASQETVKKYIKQISKIRAQIRRDYNKSRVLLKNAEVFAEVL